jgi:hypothetical protein
LSAILVSAGTLACVAPGESASTMTPEPSSSSGAVRPPKIPDPAKHGDREGAVYLASHWADLIDYTRQTVDATPLRELVLPSCKSCSQLIDQLDADKAAGTHYEGGRIHFLSADPTAFEKDKTATVSVMFEESELRVLDRSGKRTETVPANRSILVFDLVWEGSGWKVAAIKLGVENSSEPPTPSR